MYKKKKSALNAWREMMCTKMQKSLNHCETPDGLILMGDICRNCRYSHPPLNIEDND